jgi:hypothetical protein
MGCERFAIRSAIGSKRGAPRFVSRRSFRKRYAVLTIRNLTAHSARLGWFMHVIKIQRSIRKGNRRNSSATGRSFRRFGRDFFATENQVEFAIEALLFGVLVAVSAWPIVAAAGAINKLL